MAPKAVILSGGPASVTETHTPRAPDWVFTSGLPVLGICYGEQTMVAQLGGEVEGGHHREFGRAEIEVVEDSALFHGFWPKGARDEVWMSHGDRVTRLPDGFRVVAVSKGAPFAAIADEARRLYAVQFHPEVVHAARGRVCSPTSCTRLRAWPATGPWRTSARARLRASGRRSAAAASSRAFRGRRFRGGVVLIHEAIGDQLTCIFVDHGLLRQDEAEEVVSLFRGAYNIPLVHVDARERFLAALAGKADPEAKRKTIGALFIEVFEEEAAKIGGAAFLAQGTLYPDVIESVSFTGGPSVTIKVAPQRRRAAWAHEPEARRGLARTLQGRGARTGRSSACQALHRAPSLPRPGARHPHRRGRAEKLDILRQADAIYLDEIRKAGSTTRSGRRSRCCCRYARSASWATRAPTTTCARCAPSPPPTA